MSNIVRLRRIFRPRLEVCHHQVGSSASWAFRLEYIGELGRQLVGIYEEVGVAFFVALAFREDGVRVACIERGRP